MSEHDADKNPADHAPAPQGPKIELTGAGDTEGTGDIAPGALPPEDAAPENIVSEAAAQREPEITFGPIPTEGGASSDDDGSAEESSPADPLDRALDSPWAQDPAARIAELEAEVAELNDKVLRTLAESENVRRRAQRDKEDASKYAIKNFAEGMLGVADNLGRAMASIDADARAADPNLENLFVGVDMVQREAIATFERYGITPIKALGAKFDPMQHEAMFEIEDTNTPAGTIAQVLEPGYTLNGRTLRAAKVGITKGGPKEAPAPAPTESAETAGASDTDADPATRDGQAAYESQTDSKDTSGGNLDQEL